MEKKIKLLPPLMPNYISIEQPARPRQEGVDFDKFKIPITDLDELEAAAYGELMKQTFIRHWIERKNNQKG